MTAIDPQEAMLRESMLQAVWLVLIPLTDPESARRCASMLWLNTSHEMNDLRSNMVKSNFSIKQVGLYLARGYHILSALL
jgi:hypothetical protein